MLPPPPPPSPLFLHQRKAFLLEISQEETSKAEARSQPLPFTDYDPTQDDVSPQSCVRTPG